MRLHHLLAILLPVLLVSATARAGSVLSASLPAPVAAGTAALVARPAADSVVDFQISLPGRDAAGLDRLIAAIETPTSASYRRYLTQAAFTARFGPTAAAYDTLLGYARQAGFTVTATAANRRLVGLRGTVAQVDQALHVVLGLYRHPTESRLFLSPDREPTPDLATPVLAITGLDTYVTPVARLVRAAADAAVTTGSGPGGQFIGSDMRAAYYGGTALTGAGQSVGLFELAGYNMVDVQHYFASLNQPLNVPVVGISVAGAALSCTGTCDDSEQSLDIEEAIAMAPGQRQVSVYVGKVPILILNAMAAADTERQLSCSWGWGAHPAAEEPIFKEYIAQGQSFLVATGDDGYLLKLGVVWPADDAFVTAVGGTGLVTDGPGGPWSTEFGWTGSGGGPSPDGIALPAYQAPFVTVQNQASSTLRNVPDIAAEAKTNNYSCYDLTCNGGNGGTSYAAPRWAGFLALANEQASERGAPAIGFLNPMVYGIAHNPTAYAADFHDEVGGFNGKYSAAPGYDLVTGLGSPGGQALIDALSRP